MVSKIDLTNFLAPSEHLLKKYFFAKIFHSLFLDPPLWHDGGGDRSDGGDGRERGEEGEVEGGDGTIAGETTTTSRKDRASQPMEARRLR